MKVRERDLRHDADPVRFGAAMTVCEGYAPECSYQGRCTRDGQCFASPAHLVAARMIESLLPTDGRAGMHYAYLQKVAQMLRDDQIDL
ncbi:hypothetical protein EIK56_18230 [Sphingomonas sp. C8-2]|nr:hypothetical protein EIK56_18230 [Sphingomonas sp. C8-2]